MSVMSPRALAAAAVLCLALLAAGCGASTAETGSVPESAKLAPADAVGFVTLVTDESSEQWENADRLLSLFPDARAQLLEEVRAELAQEDLSWDADVAPALGDELVVVVTADKRPIVLLQPGDEERLAALLEKADDPPVRGSVSGWTALAETRADLDTYLAALDRATLEGVGSFSEAMEGLPDDALARGWVDLRPFLGELTSALQGSGVKGELGVDWLAAGITAEDDGVHLSMGIRTPGDNGSSYEPELVERVPADAVAVVSFGGTQGILDRVEDAVDVDAISNVLQDAVGVSLDSLVEALSGEGVLYVREGVEDVPEVTLVLAPPDAGEAFDSVNRVARRVAEQTGEQVRTRAEGALTVHELRAEGITVTYARLDDDRVIVTTGASGIADFLSDGPKLADADGFETAAERVELGERTRGFAYVDIDGVVPLVEGLAGQEAVPDEAREVLETLDSFILLASGDGPTTRLSGFLRVTR